MLVDNSGGLPAGDTDSPVTLSRPRGGIPPVVSTPDRLAEAARSLRSGSAPLAVDTERAQGYRYGPQAWLVQLRREDVGTFLIDAHAMPDLSGLREATRGLWILHAADQDLPCLALAGLAPQSLFDTEIAARLVGLPRFGLGAVVEEELGLSLVKDHQASDWSTRPLPEDWLRYAALDVELLTALWRRLSERLETLGRTEWARQEFRHAMSKPGPEPRPDRWRSLPGAGRVRTRRGLAVLRELWETRDALARDADLAPGRMVRNSALVRAALQPPRTRRALLAIGEFRSPTARAHRDAWLRAIRRALTADESELPPRRAPEVPGRIPDARHWQHQDPDAFARLQVVRRAVRARAEQLAIEPAILLEPRAQRSLAWGSWARHTLETAGYSSFEEAAGARLQEAGARPWQIEQTLHPIVLAARAAQIL